MMTLRDPVHGFIQVDPLEAALIDSRPMQRLRWIHQLGLTFLVFPGAEHSRFSHALGALHMAGRVFDALAERRPEIFPPTEAPRLRRQVRAAALLHDIGHAPFSHSSEELFADGIDHEEMSRRLLALSEVEEVFERHGDGLAAGDVRRLLDGGKGAAERLLFQVVSGELDADKMDYLLRDSLYCGVRYGTYDLDRLLNTIAPIRDPETGEWGLGVVEGGVHALEALVMARYYMFTQVYFNVTGKVLELHLNEWLREEGTRWPSRPDRFLQKDDLSVVAALRDAKSPHARAVVERDRYALAFETREHLTPEEKGHFEELLPELAASFGEGNLLISNSAKDPHQLSRSRVLVERFDGGVEPMAEASQFIRYLTRIDRYRVYAPGGLRDEVRTTIRRLLAR